MTTGSASSPPVSDGTRYVADLLPATAPPPEPARRINFLAALLLFWLLPRRYGPHLAAGSWTRALAAHAASVVIAAVILALPFVLAALGRENLTVNPRGLRVALAEGVLKLAQTSAMAPFPWALAVVVLGGVPLAELGLLLIATAAMPWCAGGDRASSVWKRSAKNVYWSTTVLIPAAVVATVVRSGDPAGPPSDVLAILVVLVLLIVPPVVILRMLVVGAGRYVGEPDGPAFAPREPRCDRCGYTLIKLPAENNCPECGLPVRDSLPGGRRRPTVWQQNELRPRGFVELIRLQWVVLRDPTFFDRLLVQSGVSAARHFWWGTFLLILFTFLAASEVGSLAIHEDSPLQQTFVAVAALAVVVPFPLQAAIMCSACLWSQFRYGIADYRVSAVVCYYTAPLMWPLMGALVLAVAVASEPVASPLMDLKLYLSRSGAFFTAWHVALLSTAVLAITLLLWWGRRLTAALRSVRYANV